MNSPAKTHFTISPEEWMKLPKAKLWRDWGNAGDLHNLLDEYAVELSERVADVRPTRDQIAQCIFNANERASIRVMEQRRDAMAWKDAPSIYRDVLYEIADAVLALFGVAVSDSQETLG